ncbi:MAG: mechanosensitive ion channel family protein [Rickettsiaceae bacterium]
MHFDSIQAQILTFIPQLIGGILASLPFIILFIINKFVIRGIIARRISAEHKYLAIFIGKFINGVVWIVAIITLLGTWGVDVRALIAGFGVTSFAIGFALKDLIANLLAGIMIIVYRPLTVNSQVSILGIEGVVVKIDLRYTTIKSQKSSHLVPNAKILSEVVTILEY